MKEGILEVLLVNAKHIKHNNLLGSPSYYVVIECGTQEHRTKVSSGKHENAWWNEKFTFQLPSCGWRNINHIKFKIMETEILNSKSVGETTIHIGGIISEGYRRGSIQVKPALYNVVLQDDTYKGEIKIGFKFFAKEEMPEMEARECTADEIENKPRTSICGSLWRVVWIKFLCFCDHKNSSNRQKQL